MYGPRRIVAVPETHRRAGADSESDRVCGNETEPVRRRERIYYYNVAAVMATLLLLLLLLF